MWSEGIGDGDFSREEILEDFNKMNIKIPETLLKDLDNHIEKRIKNNRK